MRQPIAQPLTLDFDRVWIVKPERGRLLLGLLSSDEINNLLAEKLDVDGEVNGEQLPFGNASKTVCEGNDYRLALDAGFFGDGSNGALVLDGLSTVLGVVPVANVYTLNRSVFAQSLIVNAGVTVRTGGFKIFVAGTLTNFGTISNSGNNGSNAVNQNAASGGTGIGAAEVGGGSAGGSSSAGSPGSAANGGAGIAGTNSMGGSGAVGGNGGAVPSLSSGGTGGNAGAQTVRVFRALSHHLLAGNGLVTGGVGGGGGAGGGGSGGANYGGAGGGGGSGGGVIAIFAASIFNHGKIAVTDGNGGNGANGTLGDAGGGGGGGGGGGVVFLVYNTFEGSGLITAAGGVGGNSGLGSGTGIPGSLGNNGAAGVALRYNGTSKRWE